MTIVGRWPRAIFYDSKTTLFDWAWSWRQAAEQIVQNVNKLKNFTPDFVGSTEQARVHKPNPRVYRWVLHQVGLEPRDVLYCAAPQFDIQGALSCGLKAAWLRRQQGRLGRKNVTFDVGDVPADYEIEDLHQLTRIVEANLRPT